MNASRSKRFLSALRSLGPYLLIELLLPGGTLLALLLWLSQGMTRSVGGVVPQSTAVPAALQYAIAAPGMRFK